MLLVQAVIHTAAVLSGLRDQLVAEDLHAYIIPYGGQHFDERVAACDARIAAISGFTGSAASVIVTLDQALLWTDGRYFLQANLTLEEGWELMKGGEIGTPSESEWLNSKTGITKIGVDARTYPKSSWDSMKSQLSSEKTLVATEKNLVNEAWGGGRPLCPNNAVFELEIAFSGKSVADKLADVRKELTNAGASALVVSELDEVAWLLNLRGTDLPSASTFFGFVILGDSNLLDVFIDNEIPDEVKTNLEDLGATFHPYAEVTNRLKTIQDELPANAKIWVSKYANAELANSVEASGKQMIKLTPIILMKSLKNDVEVQGMRSAHLKDSAAIIAFFSWIDAQMEAGVTDITELSAAVKLLKIREKGEHFMGRSFASISAFGANGAIIHYRATEETDATITSDGTYLLDSGGLYLDGTTDITRTVHFGTPTAEMKDRFTRVLKGHIAVATAIFPNKLTGHRLDSLARKPLWDIGEDYKHGTGHGIGHYLNLHEGPQKVSFFAYEDDSGLEENMFMSNEPGFYKEGEYGIRLENIVRVAKAEIEGYLQIETVSFVPIQKKMIDITLLTDQEIEWVNEYHEQCREKVLEHMMANPDNEFFTVEAQNFLTRETSPIEREVETTTEPPNTTTVTFTTTAVISTTTPTASTTTPSISTTTAAAPKDVIFNYTFLMISGLISYAVKSIL